MLHRRAADAVPVRGADRRPAATGCAASGQRRRRSSPGPLFAEGEPATCFYVLLDGDDRAAPSDPAAMDIETDPDQPARRVLRRLVGLPRRASRRPTRRRCGSRSRRGCSRSPPRSCGGFLRTGSRWRATCSRGRSGAVQPEPHRRPARAAARAGSLSAGLTHELNNPAAAAARATSELRERVAGMRHKLALLADGSTSLGSMQTLVDISNETAAALTVAHELSPLQKSDREDAIGDWLDDARRRRRVGHRPGVRRAGARRRLARPGAGRDGRHRRLAGPRGALAELHRRNRTADERDRRRHRTDLGAGRRGQAVLAARPRALRRRRPADAADRHAGDAVAQTGPADHGGPATSTTPCRPSPAGPPSSTRCGPT